MEKKFELTDKFVFNTFGIKLFQIKCTKSFKYAKEGDLGGYVEKDENLDQESDAWCPAMLRCPAMLGCPAMLRCTAMLRCPAMLV